MTPTPVFYELLLRGDESGQLAGMHYRERTVYHDDARAFLFERLGDPEPVAAGSERLAQILPALNAASLAQVQTLTALLDAATAATRAAQADAAAQASLVEQLQAQLAALTAAPVPPAPADDGSTTLLGTLNDAYDALIPEADRVTFAPLYATVRALVQAGRRDLARGVVEAAIVPDALAGAKAQILAILT